MMKRIGILDQAKENRTTYEELNINSAFGEAYFYSIEAGNGLINFDGALWDRDIAPIIEECRKFGVKEFTISGAFSGITQTIALFEENGCTLEGLVKINSRYEDWKTGEKEILPAFKMSL